MTATPISRRTKALTLAPLLATSAIWSMTTLTGGAVADGGGARQASPLPDDTVMPDQALAEIANMRAPGSVASAVTRSSVDQVVASSNTSAIPSSALSAYQRADQIMARTDDDCRVPWELVAAVGRVESDHGRSGGSSLTEGGVATPAIYGPRLDGRPGTSVIVDTDAGELDGDRKHDRAVGPMQFLPSTWQLVKVDADGDGRRNVQDIDDAALAAAVYLCSGSENLSTRGGRESAVYRYNHSHEYVALVLRIAESYSTGDYSAIPSGVHAGTVFTPAVTSPGAGHSTQGPKGGPKGHTSAPADDGAGDSPKGEQPPAPTPSSPSAPAPGPAPSPSPSPTSVPPAPADPVRTLVGTLQQTTTTLTQCAANGNVLGVLEGPDAACS